jgi:hypothetical protein
MIPPGLKRVLLGERGSFEAALLLLPLTLLFLIGMQLALSSHSRNMEALFAQDEASARAIAGQFQEGDEFIEIESSGDNQNIDLLVTHRERPIRNLIPSLSSIVGRQRLISVDGIAVIENRR